jgi:hypothetical protein
MKEETDLDDVILAWGAIVPDLPPATRSAVQNAQPVRCEGDVLVFGVAPELLGAARERFKREADNVRDALAAKLGQRFKFNLIPEPSFSMRMDAEQAPAGGVSPPAASDAMEEVSPAAASDAVEEEEEHDFDPDAESVPAPAEPPPVSRLRNELGATVVEELPRES